MSIKKYYNFAKKDLFHLNRSITGKGIRKTLKLIKKELPELKIKSYPSGKKIFDWKVPNEWNVNEAYILDKQNKKIIDFKKNNLHLVGYSIPIKKILTRNKLIKKIHSIKNQPSAIPYRTNYYNLDWGFCCSNKTLKEIKNNYKNNDKFKVYINSKFNKKGKLYFGEYLIKGKSKKEILISTYVCHPSMANNELSGPIVSMALINFFKKKYNNMTIRFLFIPETIGSISYIYHNKSKLKKKVVGGYILSCIGDEKKYSCMLSKYKNTSSDYALLEAYKKLQIKFKKYSFLENGSDERQFCSPMIELPLSSIFRSKYGTYPEYHTSLDDFKLVTIKGLTGGFNVAKKAVQVLLNYRFPKTNFICEPQMGKRGMYPLISLPHKTQSLKNIMNFIQYSNGKNHLEKISEILKINFSETKKIYNYLKKNKIIS